MKYTINSIEVTNFDYRIYAVKVGAGNREKIVVDLPRLGATSESAGKSVELGSMRGHKLSYTLPRTVSLPIKGRVVGSTTQVEFLPTDVGLYQDKHAWVIGQQIDLA